MDILRGDGFIGSHFKDAYRIGRDLNIPPGDISTIWYTASYGNMYDQKDNREIVKVNCTDLKDLIKNTGNFNLLVYFSSSSVYGTKFRPMKETMIPKEDTPYALAKIGAEDYLHSLKGKYNLVVVRPFSVTGVGEQSQHLIPTAIRCALTGETLNLDPDPVHDYIDVNDVISACYIIRDFHLEWGKGFEIYNIGSGQQHRNDQVIDIIEQLTGRKITKRIVSKMRSYDTQTMWQADITKLKRLGWKPKVSLVQSIKSQIDDYRYRSRTPANIQVSYTSIQESWIVSPLVNPRGSTNNL